MRRILIVKMWALGDIVMATPLIPTLLRHYPDIEIDWLADMSHAEILRGHPHIRDLISFPTGVLRGKLRRGDILGWLREARSVHLRLKANGYDAVINCHPDKTWTRILCPAPIRIGLYSTPTAPASRALYTHALVRPTDPPIHNTEHYLLAAQALGCKTMEHVMSIGCADGEMPDLELTPAKPIVVIAPFTTAENRCWEPERYARLADAIIRDCGAQAAMTCSSKEKDAGFRIVAMAKERVALLAGTTLQHYASLIRRADLVISGDTSAMHIAAAVGTPYLALFGPTPVSERAPMAGVGKALSKPLRCAPCDKPTCSHPVFRECMELLSVEEVANAARELLSGRAPQKT